MINDKVNTVEQLKGSITSLIIVASLIVGSILYKFGYDIFNANMVGIGIILVALSIYLTIYVFVIWALRNRMFEKGVKYSIKHYSVKKSIRQQLIEAGIFTQKIMFGVNIVTLPNVEIHFDDGYLTGRVAIETSIKHNKKLETIDITPALGRYVVEQQYLSKNKKRFVYEFYDSSINRKYEFESFNDLKQQFAGLNDYEINVDKNINVPLSHSLIVGQTRSGKSYMLLVSILQMLCKRIKYNLFLIDPKISSISLIGKKIDKNNTAVEFGEIVSLLERFTKQMNARKLEMSELLQKKYDGDYRTFNLEPHVLIFDEYASFSIMLSTVSKSERDKINSMISQIVLQGSQLGFFIWIVMQKSDSQNIPTSIRDNLLFKIVLGSAEEQTYVTAFGNVDVPKFKFELGEGLFTYPSITEKPKLCSITTLNFDINKAFDELS